MKNRRAGYSFIELLVVLIFMGLLTRIAIPRYADMKRRALAASIIGDVHAVRLGAFTRYAQDHNWPPDYGAGVVPTELVEYLPPGFTFTRPDWEYDYEVWTLSGGTPQNPTQEELVGLAVTVNDQRLVTNLLRLASRGYGPFVNGSRVTFVFTGISWN